ncbi:MAG: aldehyde dehydrogenase [Candidatus Fraserbacteria bacterium RBG_16_55_9]|uniref:Aldehyde dehydrogenase n=1 Tax=Fraserbacteria sp. (strain RBG_16_55_9) TaxID=1817864 RepID=A0A1F5UP59_FRAXR|nr:MAG: aldehyde dehydrogenase [Candidatus Fraserbacteria bacterium RBG_16_55_9]
MLSPYVGSVIAEVSEAGAEETEQAIAAAESAYLETKRLPAHQRAEILYKTAEKIEFEKEQFAEIIALEAGKPWRYALAEAGRAVQTFRFAAEEAKRLHGETIPMDAAVGAEGRIGFFIRQPLGVIAAISPFNFPLNLVAHKLAPALAAGNTVVLKPASKTPLTALKLGEVLLDAGLPPKALNIVVGPGSRVGELLIKDPRVRMITFTGSAAVGLHIKANCGSKKVLLEMGSNSGIIIDEHCDLLRAVQQSVIGGFAYQGQVCIHAQRIYVHERIYPEFVKGFLEGIQRLKAGSPLEKDSDMGPMIDERAAQQAELVVREAISQGAELLVGGGRRKNFLEPTVLARVHSTMKAVCEEIFAPVVALDTFSSFREGIRKFNEGSHAGSHRYGLSVGVFTDNLKHAFQAIEELEIGSVLINDPSTFRADQMPYGGIGESGLGREGPRFAIEEMTEIKMISLNVS